MGFQRLTMSKECKLKLFLYVNTSLNLGGFLIFSLSYFFFIESKRTMGHELLQFTYEYPEFTFQSASATCQHLRSGVKWESADFYRQNALQKLEIYSISHKIETFFATYVFTSK